MKRAIAGRQRTAMLRMTVLRITAALLSLHTKLGFVCQGVCVCLPSCCGVVVFVLFSARPWMDFPVLEMRVCQPHSLRLVLHA